MQSTPKIVSRADYLERRRELLAREKQLTRESDAIAAARRALPWVRVDADYAFVDQHGRHALPDLFSGRDILVVYHFMFPPGAEAGCKLCAFWSDHFDAARTHLAARGVTLAVVSRGAPEALVPFAARMGWKFPWYTAVGDAFSHDFGAYFTEAEVQAGAPLYNHATEPPRPHLDHPGISVFARDASGDVFHTYSCYARGLEAVNSTYQFLDLTPRGRDEDGLSFSMEWVRLHDEYEV